MSGTYYRLADPAAEQPFEFTIRAATPNVSEFAKTRVWTVDGRVRAKGLAEDAPFEGSLEFRLFDERRLVYRCSFPGDDGMQYELFGQKDWLMLAPLRTLTTLPGTILHEGNEVARFTVRIDLRKQGLKFASSFRPTLSL